MGQSSLLLSIHGHPVLGKTSCQNPTHFFSLPSFLPCNLYVFTCDSLPLPLTSFVPKLLQRSSRGVCVLIEQVMDEYALTLLCSCSLQSRSFLHGTNDIARLSFKLTKQRLASQNSINKLRRFFSVFVCLVGCFFTQYVYLYIINAIQEFCSICLYYSYIIPVYGSI